MICHQQKTIFIHIPRTAGQSIERVFLKQAGLSWENRAPLLLKDNNDPTLGPPYLAHLTAQEYVKYGYLSQDTFDHYYKFAFVRNPWDRVVSFYKYFGYDRKITFKRFLHDVLYPHLWNEYYYFIRPQFEYIFDNYDVQIIDFIGHFESLDQDFRSISSKVGIQAMELPHVNRSDRVIGKFSFRPRRLLKYLKDIKKDRMETLFKNFHEYYDEDDMGLVQNLYQKDILSFNYRF